MNVLGWTILTAVGLLFAISSWRLVLGLTASDIPQAGDIPIRVTPQTAIWAAMTIFSGLLFAVCLA